MQKTIKFFSNNSSVIIILILFVIRLIISLLTYNSNYESDEGTYLNLITNVVKNFNFGLSDGSTIIFLDNQWYIGIFYIPIISFTYNKIFIVLFNNVIFIISVILITKITLNKFSIKDRRVFYSIAFLFPPFFEITNKLLTEDVFILLMSLVLFFYYFYHDREKNFIYYVVLLFLSISFLNTRPVAVLFIFILLLITIIEKRYIIFIVLIFSIISSLLINKYLNNLTTNEQGNANNRFIDALYFTNSVFSDGSTDNFKNNHYLSDTIYLKYKSGDLDTYELLENLITQIINNPLIYLNISINKTVNYFFRIWPQSWSYPYKQNIYRQFYELIINTIFYFLFIYGYIVNKRNNYINKGYTLFLILIFFTNFIFHFIFICRYRYNLPIIFLCLPIIYIGLKEFYSKFIHYIKSRFYNHYSF